MGVFVLFIHKTSISVVHNIEIRRARFRLIFNPVPRLVDRLEITARYLQEGTTCSFFFEGFNVFLQTIPKTILS
mgnify:CR=1 FL=1